MATVRGGCYCGAIRYEVTGEIEHSLVCHCPDCRRAIGSQSVAYIFLNSSDFNIISGVPTEFNSSEGVVRKFCGKCGTTLSWEGEKQPGRIDVTTASLDDPEQFPPTKAVYRRHRLSWASEI